MSTVCAKSAKSEYQRVGAFMSHLCYTCNHAKPKVWCPDGTPRRGWHHSHRGRDHLRAHTVAPGDRWSCRGRQLRRILMVHR